MALKLTDLFTNGSIVALHTSMWRARTKIKAPDLGIPETQEVNRVLSLGQHRLAPKEAFESIVKPAGVAERAIQYASLNFAMIPGARYVPDTGLPELLAKLKECRREFNGAVSEFIANYGDMKTRMLPMIEQALKDAAKDPQMAQAAFDRVKSEYPSSEDIQQKFALYWNVYTVQGAKSAAVEDALQNESEEVKSIVRSMVEQLRGELTGKISDIMGVIAKGGKLPARSVESALTMIRRVESLNVIGDEELSRQIVTLRTALETWDSGKEVDDAFTTGLSGIKDSLEKSIEEAVKEAEANLTGLGRRRFSA